MIRFWYVLGHRASGTEPGRLVIDGNGLYLCVLFDSYISDANSVLALWHFIPHKFFCALTKFLL
jgi:hypothetical protein